MIISTAQTTFAASRSADNSRLDYLDATRAFALLLNYLDGMSPQRQFYLSRTRYAGIEVRFDL